MFPGGPNNEVNTEAQNAPNLAFAANPILGNTQFNIMTPPTKGDVQQGFPQLPYQSLESLLYFQMMSNPMSAPYTQYGGATAGNQVVQGQYTVADSVGNTRILMGFSQGAF